MTVTILFLLYKQQNVGTQYRRDDANGESNGAVRKANTCHDPKNGTYARVMKFLAEITAFFLPLTALAVSLTIQHPRI
jgi:hypothetical protein